jgi:hypothetical protein
MVLNLNEDVNYDLVGEVVESFVKVFNASFVMLPKYFKFRIRFIKLQRNYATNNVCEHIIEGQSVRVVVLDRSDGVRVLSLLPFKVSLLTHNSDRLVRGFDGDWLDIG